MTDDLKISLLFEIIKIHSIFIKRRKFIFVKLYIHSSYIFTYFLYVEWDSFHLIASCIHCINTLFHSFFTHSKANYFAVLASDHTLSEVKLPNDTVGGGKFHFHAPIGGALINRDGYSSRFFGGALFPFY